jgi:hypothetical protein
MIRTFLLIVITTISVRAQDSTFVREFCETLIRSGSGDAVDIDSRMQGITETYFARNSTTFSHSIQDLSRFQYRLSRELMKTCSTYKTDRIRLLPKVIFDLEGLLTTQEKDSLRILARKLNEQEKVHLYIVTIDDFYPDSTIADVSNRYREFWAPRTLPEKGVILIAISRHNREVRISTGDSSMTYLTDDECKEVNKVMILYFRDGGYFEGLLAGLLAIESRL